MELVTYERVGRAARIRMDDGRLNLMNPAMLSALDAAFDRAAADGVIAVLSGRQDIFSAGFDLKVFRSGDAAASKALVRQGAELALKVLSFPRPVITATEGHAYPMGAFLMLSADWRIGADSGWKGGLNEVAIGLTVPSFALELARQRLAPAWFSRTAITGELFVARDAIEAGLIDALVPVDGVETAIEAAIARLSTIDFGAHAATKRRARRGAIAAVRAAIDAELLPEPA
ncbi:MAG: crotonase/enoyl-CoA hydratase family protein [Caulobacter sp.]|nr:crotonase/enoyl-CoA hydratase family protein [Caulobacter sp.]